MKAVLMAFSPEECKKIFSGEKTVDVRKIAPKLETPYRVYMYQTKEKGGVKIINDCLNSVYGGGKVVGEFVCDGIEEFKKFGSGVRFKRFRALYETRLSLAEMREYMGNHDKVKGLHIAEPKRYDTPKELWEFTPWCEKSRNIDDNLEMCCNCKNAFSDEDGVWLGCRVTRPPQSWMYVEEIEE